MSEQESLAVKYSNIKQINTGGFGVIYKCQNKTKKNRNEVLKMVPLKDKSYIEIECSEIIQNNSHKYIISIFDVFILTNKVYINMEYHSESDLFDIIDDPFKRILLPYLSIISQILQPSQSFT